MKIYYSSTYTPIKNTLRIIIALRVFSYYYFRVFTLRENTYFTLSTIALKASG